MDESQITSFYPNVCRICAENKEEMKQLFITYVNKLTLSEMLAICLKTSIHTNDGLPSVICVGCTENLKTSFKFQNQCAKSEELFRNIKSKRLKAKEPNQTRIIDMEPSVDSVSGQTSIKHELMDDLDLVSSKASDNDANKLDNDEMYLLEPNVKIEIIQKIDDQTEIKHENYPKQANRKQFECLHCHKIFEKLYRLKRHLSVHDPEGRPFECEVCRVRFERESSLIRHGIKHTNIISESTTILQKIPKTFQCHECAREFSKQVSFASHMKTHKRQMDRESSANGSDAADSSAQRTFLCEYCPRTFSKLNKLTRHVRVHDEVKSHQCNMCSKKFSLASVLIDHLNKHRGIKPHICPVCQKGIFIFA